MCGVKSSRVREPVMDINKRKATNHIIQKYNGLYMRRSPAPAAAAAAAAAAGMSEIKLAETCH
jgi:hypothetical protein